MDLLACMVESIPHWDFGYQLKQDVVDQFESERLKFLNRLKEKITIGKATAGFFKKATEKHDERQVICGETKELVSLDRYLIDLLVMFQDGKKKGNTFLEICQSFGFVRYDVEWKGRDIIKEPEVTKEILRITSETRSFLKDSLRSEFKVGFNHHFIDKAKTFEIDMLDQQIDKSFTDPLSYNFETIDATQFEDHDYLEEKLSYESHFSIEFEKDSSDSLPVLAKTDCIIPIIDSVTMDEKTEVIRPIEFELWNCPSFITQSKEPLLQLVQFVTEEELQRGVEYLIKPPFIEDSPTFEEPMGPLDLVDIDEMIPYRNIKSTKDVNLEETMSGVSELEVLKEDLYETKNMVAHYSESKLMPIKEFDVFLLEVEDNCIRSEITLKTCDQSSYKRQSDQLVIINDQDVNNSNDLSVLQDTNIKIGSATEITDKTSLKSINSNTSLNATKMATTMNNITEDSVLKRGIDDDLDEIIAKKRKKVKRSNNACEKSSNASNLASMLLSNTKIHELPCREEDTIVDTESTGKDSPKDLTLFPKPITADTHYIGINTSLMDADTNSQIIRQFYKDVNIEVVEFELGKDDVDFVISETHGLIVLELRTCTQASETGDLVIQQRLFKSLVEFKKLDVLLVIGSNDNFENLTHIQTCLAMMSMFVHTVNNNIQNITQWIHNIALANCGDLGKYNDIDETKPSINFLKNCGINEIAGSALMEETDLAEFIVMGNQERKERYSHLLPSAQLDYINSLFNLDWQWDSEE